MLTFVKVKKVFNRQLTGGQHTDNRRLTDSQQDGNVTEQVLTNSELKDSPITVRIYCSLPHGRSGKITLRYIRENHRCKSSRTSYSESIAAALGKLTIGDHQFGAVFGFATIHFYAGSLAIKSNHP